MSSREVKWGYMGKKTIVGKIASLDVDSQNGFTPICPSEIPVEGGHLIAEELNLQAELADFRIGSKDAHATNAVWVADDTSPPFSPLEGKHVDMAWPLHCVPGTKGFELIQGLPHVDEYDYFVWKGVEPDMHPYGACFHDLENKLSTGIIEYLKINHVKWVIVGGLALDYCVKSSVLQLLAAGFNVIVNKAACASVDEKTSLHAIQQMKSNGAILLESANEVKSFMREDDDSHH
jgi:nicotinamidase/pyrazinamidase